MEAIDCFRKSWELDPKNNEARFLLSLALIYRYIYGETKEFVEHFNYLTQILNSHDHPLSIKAKFVFGLMFHEFKEIGRLAIRKKDYDSVLRMLQETPAGSIYLSKIQQSIEGAIVGL